MGGRAGLCNVSSLLLFLLLRIRKVWQKRKCGVKYGCLTISHSTVRSSGGAAALTLEGTLSVMVSVGFQV